MVKKLKAKIIPKKEVEDIVIKKIVKNLRKDLKEDFKHMYDKSEKRDIKDEYKYNQLYGRKLNKNIDNFKKQGHTFLTQSEDGYYNGIIKTNKGTTEFWSESYASESTGFKDFAFSNDLIAPLKNGEEIRTYDGKRTIEKTKTGELKFKDENGKIVYKIDPITAKNFTKFMDDEVGGEYSDMRNYFLKEGWIKKI